MQDAAKGPFFYYARKIVGGYIKMLILAYLHCRTRATIRHSPLVAAPLRIQATRQFYLFLCGNLELQHIISKL